MCYTGWRSELCQHRISKVFKPSWTTSLIQTWWHAFAELLLYFCVDLLYVVWRSLLSLQQRHSLATKFVIIIIILSFSHSLAIINSLLLLSLLLVLALAELKEVQSRYNDHHDYSFNFSVSHATGNCINDSSCPTWHFCNSGRCQCGESHNDVIKCINDRNMSAVLDCYCVTYDEDTESTFVGACFYNCVNLKGHDLVYHPLPEKPDELINNSVCSQFHRKGLLCGECEEGLSPFVLSYNLSCVDCQSGYTNWWKFVLVGFFHSHSFTSLWWSSTSM